MATEAAKGQGNTDSITSFLGTVQLYTSMIGFVIQVWLTSKIQRYLGIGFALLILPTSLGITGTIMLLNGALLSPALARVIDTSLRYTVDKTTREILFLPLPNDLKQQAKPFIDVTVDRFSKGIGALLVLFLIKDQIFGFHVGLGLNWQQLSWASLAMIGLWVCRDFPRSTRIPAHFPPIARSAGGGAGSGEAERSRPLDDRNARRGTGPSEPAPRDLRDRHARVAEQAATGEPAAPQSRVSGRARAGTGHRRGRLARVARSVDARGRADVEGRRAGGPCRCRASARDRPRRAGGRTDASAPRRSRSTPGRHRSRRPRLQFESGGRQGGIRSHRAAGRRHAPLDGWRTPRRRAGACDDHEQGFPSAAGPVDVRHGPRRGDRGDPQRRPARCGRLPVRATTRRTAAPPPAQVGCARRARRLRRERPRHAGVFPPRSGRGHLDPAPYSRDAGPDSEPEDDGHSRGRARRARRIPSLQGRQCDRAAAPVAPRSDRAGR